MFAAVSRRSQLVDSCSSAAFLTAHTRGKSLTPGAVYHGGPARAGENIIKYRPVKLSLYTKGSLEITFARSLACASRSRPAPGTSHGVCHMATADAAHRHPQAGLRERTGPKPTRGARGARPATTHHRVGRRRRGSDERRRTSTRKSISRRYQIIECIYVSSILLRRGT